MKKVSILLLAFSLLILSCNSESVNSTSGAKEAIKAQPQANLTPAQMEKMDISVSSKNNSRLINSGIMAKTQKEEAFVSGMVHLLYKGKQIPGYGVSIELSSGGNTFPADAKKNGVFGAYVPAGMYTAIIKNDGYQNLELKDIALTPGLIRNVEVELAPE